MNKHFSSNFPKEIYSGAYPGGHVQGIAVDTERKYIYFSFTTHLVKTDLEGNLIGSVTGLTGHLGCISFCKRDGKVYGSLEYKRDQIGRGIFKGTGRDFGGEDAFYIAFFDGEKITKVGLDAESDGIMKAVYLPEVVRDYSEKDEADGLPHRYGCSGIDGISFGTGFGKEGGDKEEILCVAYGVYGDTERGTNDHQVLLAYNPVDITANAKPLSQAAPHKSAANHLAKYFVYTGNTTYGIQNLEYDPGNKEWLAAVYIGKKTIFPNYPLFAIDGTTPPETKRLAGRGGETGNTLTLKRAGSRFGITTSGNSAGDIYGYGFRGGQTGMYSFGDGYFYISYDGKTEDGLFFSNIKLCKRLPQDMKGFEVV